MKRLLPIFALLTGCFAEPPVGDMREPVDDDSESSADEDASSSSAAATSVGDSDGSDETTGSLMSPCPDDVICVALVVSDTALPSAIDEHDYACPASPIDVAWLVGDEVIFTTTVTCDAAPVLLQLERAPTGYRAVVDDCVIEAADAPRTCDGAPCGWGPEPGDTVLFGLIDPRIDPC